MTREEAGLARAIDSYTDLDNRIRATRVVAFWCAIGGAALGGGSLTALGAGEPWAAAAAVWMPLTAALAFAAVIGRVNLAALKVRRRERDEDRHLAELRAAARRMRIAGAFASVIVGELAVDEAVGDRRVAA